MSAPAAGSSAAVSSGSKRPFPRAVGDSDRRVHPRHFHFGRNPAAAAASTVGDVAAAAESADQPPAAMLYRHALESIFGWLDQRELVTALQVSKGWLAAVKSMASLGLTIRKPAVPLRVMAESTMGHHVVQLGEDDDYVPMTADSICTVARHMPRLRELSCQMELTPAQALLTFPPGLRVLHLVFFDKPAADVNTALRAISQLSVLEEFCLHLEDFDEQIAFAPLASLPLLRVLRINQLEDDDAPAAELSDAQVTELRGLPFLRHLDVQPMSASLLRRLLAQPHDLQWQEIALPDPLDDEVAALLPQLPTLTVLDEPLPRVTCSRFDFLRQLPKLTHAYLQMRGPSAVPLGRIESLVAGLQDCSQLEILALRSNVLTAAHLDELLPRLPRLQCLTLASGKFTTLAFLAQPPMTDQLTRFQLSECKQLPLTELRHVHALKGLESLDLNGSFNESMDALSQSLYTPPSLLMPQLEDFEYTPPDP